jgi:signal transduction histidine kinase
MLMLNTEKSLEVRSIQSLAIAIEEPLRVKDWLSISRIVRAISDSHLGSDVCIEIPPDIRIQEGSCDEGLRFVSFTTLFSEQGYRVGVRIRNRTTVYWIVVLIVSLMSATSFFLIRRIGNVAAELEEDFGQIQAGVFTKAFNFYETGVAARSVMQREDLIRRSLLLEVDATLGRRLTQTAHDLRAPLSAVKVGLHYLDVPPGEIGELIMSSLNRIKSIADGLLGDRKKLIQGDSFEIERDIVRIVREARYRLKDTGCEVELKLDIDLSCSLSVHGSDLVFQRVFTNLLDNAIEASLPCGQVLVQLRLSELGGLELRLIDSGAGFPSHVLEHWNTNPDFIKTTKADGNGVGLASSLGEATRAGWQPILSNVTPSGGAEVLLFFQCKNEMSNSLIHPAEAG